jgi:hypothetical protein
MMEINWIDRVRNAEVLNRRKEERNILHTVNRREANWIGHILRRNGLLKHVIEGKIEGRIDVTGRGGRRSKKLLDEFKRKRECWKLKEEALDRILWRTRYGRGNGAAAEQTTE